MATPTSVSTKTPLEMVMTKTLAEIVVNPDLMRLLRLDLRVTAEPSQHDGYDHMKFTLTLSPGLFQFYWPGKMITVNVIAVPETGIPWVQAIQMPSNGGTKVIDATITGVDYSKLHGTSDKGQTIMVVADPLNQLYERNEGNNVASAYCYTIG